MRMALLIVLLRPAFRRFGFGETLFPPFGIVALLAAQYFFIQRLFVLCARIVFAGAFSRSRQLTIEHSQELRIVSCLIVRLGANEK
jgi:hypothetical protein